MKPFLAVSAILLSFLGAPPCKANAPDAPLVPFIVREDQTADPVANAKTALHRLSEAKSLTEMADCLTNRTAGYYGICPAVCLNMLTKTSTSWLGPSPATTYTGGSCSIGQIGDLTYDEINYLLRDEGVEYPGTDGPKSSVNHSRAIIRKRLSGNSKLLHGYLAFAKKYRVLTDVNMVFDGTILDIPSPMKQDGRRFLIELDSLINQFSIAFPKSCGIKIENKYPTDYSSCTFTPLADGRVEINTRNSRFIFETNKVWAVKEDGKWRIDIGDPKDIYLRARKDIEVEKRQQKLFLEDQKKREERIMKADPDAPDETIPPYSYFRVPFVQEIREFPQYPGGIRN